MQYYSYKSVAVMVGQCNDGESLTLLGTERLAADGGSALSIKANIVYIPGQSRDRRKNATRDTQHIITINTICDCSLNE